MVEKSRIISKNDEELEELTCNICHHVLYKPTVTPCCRTCFCRACIDTWLSNSNTCPIDRKPLSSEQMCDPPHALSNLVNKLRVTCRFKDDGCHVVCTLGQMDDHVNECPFNPLAVCGRCGERGRGHDCVEVLKAEKERVLKKMLEMENELKEMRKNAEKEIQNRNDRSVRIVNSTMKSQTQEFALQMALEAHQKFSGQPEGRMSTYVRNAFERKFSGLWNCLVASSVDWGTSVHHLENQYVYFKVGKVHFMVWQSSK